MEEFQLLKCISGSSCQPDMPDVYVNFIQGGNNLQGLYVTTTSQKEWKVHWNVLFSIVYVTTTPAKSGAGDEQDVVSFSIHSIQLK